MSDISSDNLSTSDEEDRRTKSVAQIPDLPAPATFAKPQPPNVEGFWEQDPAREPADAPVPELEQRLSVVLELNEFLKIQEAKLQKQFEAEWAAKERVLDQLLEKELGKAP